MKEKIEQLIQHHTEACNELKMLINDLHGLRDKTDEKDLQDSIDMYSRELVWRKMFICQLEDIL